MPFTKNKSKITHSILMFIVIASGVVLLTTLLSIRSWYQPSIQLGEVSPVSIILDKEVEVTDHSKTNEAKEQARLEAIRNIKNKEILEVDYESQKDDLEKLKFIVNVLRNTISKHDPEPDPINSKVSIESQDKLLKLNDDKFNQLLFDPNTSSVLSDPKFFESINNQELKVQIKNEILELNEIERKYFLEELEKMREDKKAASEIKTNLGNTFINSLAASDYETIFKHTFIVQKKLLDLGIVRGLPRKKIKENIKILYPSLENKKLGIIQQLIDISTVPNVQINWQKVSELEKESVSTVQDVKTTLSEGALLANKGKIVEAQNFYYLKELKLLQLETDWKEIRNNFYLLASIAALITLFFLGTNITHYAINQVIMLFLVPVSVCAITASIAVWGVDKLVLAPIATITILLTVFYFPNMSAIIVTIVSFFLAKSIDMNFWQVLPQFAGALSAIFFVRKAHQREDLINAGSKIALVQIVSFLFTIVLAVEDFKVSTVVFVALLYGVGGLASGFISLAALPYLESGLKLITPFKLAELSNPTQTLLKKLKKEAPGTYEHSLNVSRLSEEASNLLNLNTELIRVGLLYHDIGKMHAPDYFIENTLGKPNPHTTLDDPKKSAEIIIAHVPEGIKMARKHNLPEAIIDFIPMHQGTTITNYFYYKAIEKHGEKNVNPNDYRYPGPKPNSKETGVAMIADSTEAALKSLKDLADESSAKEMIDKIIEARWTEGELANTGLTKSDLNKIADAFLNVWRSQNHERVKYPEKQDAE